MSEVPLYSRRTGLDRYHGQAEEFLSYQSPEVDSPVCLSVEVYRQQGAVSSVLITMNRRRSV